MKAVRCYLPYCPPFCVHFRRRHNTVVGPDLHLNWLQSGSAGLLLFLSGLYSTEQVPLPPFNFNKPRFRQLKNCSHWRKAQLTDRVIFLLLLEWRIGFSHCRMKTPENILPLTPHSSQQGRETWNDRAIWCRERGGGWGDASAICFSRRNITQPVAPDSLCMHSPAPLWINRYEHSVCVKGNDLSTGLSEWSRISFHSPAWKAYLQNWRTVWKESIYLSRVNLLIMNVCLSNRQRH